MELSVPTLDLGLALAPAGVPRLPRTADPAEARRAAQDFEAFFVAQIMEQMFAGVEPDAMFGGGVPFDAVPGIRQGGRQRRRFRPR